MRAPAPVCPTCGQRIRTRTPGGARVPSTSSTSSVASTSSTASTTGTASTGSTASLASLANTADLYAYYKRTAPVEDVRFALRAGVDLHGLTDRWQDLLARAEAGLRRSAVYAELAILHGEWRRTRLAAERITKRREALLRAQQALVRDLEELT
jgi:hypothetical protein